MVKKTSSQRNIASANKTLLDVNNTISLNQRTKQEFSKDVRDFKSKSFTSNKFIGKYPQLFNGSVAKFGSRIKTSSYPNQKEYDDARVKSFLGSLRRATNKKNYPKIQNNQPIVDLGDDLRVATVNYQTPKKTKKNTNYTDITQANGVVTSFKDNLWFKDIALSNVISLKNVWELKRLQNEKNLSHFQQVSFHINFEIYNTVNNQITKKRNPLNLGANQINPIKDGSFWITFTYGTSWTRKNNLVILHGFALTNYQEWLKKAKKYNEILIIIAERMRVIRGAV